MIINLHRMHTENVGDLLCAPALYFSLGERMEILGWKQTENPDREARSEWKERFATATGIVIGGGGLLSSEFFDPALQYIFENKRPDAKVIIWGAGHNEWRVDDWRKLKHESAFEYPYDLIGIRDYGSVHEWVPCSSCMHPSFDTVSQPTHEVVLYVHSGTIKNENFATSLPKNLPTLSNSSNFEDVLRFLASGDLILTDSYHGLYWATLLGRRVVAFPTSSKFYSAKHVAPLCDPRDWLHFSKLAVRYPFALQECRETNLRYFDRVKDILAT